jgi:hypothetical protein
MVEGTRFRLVGLVEWLLAAGLVIGLLALGAVASGEFQRVRPVVPVIAGAARAQVVPAGIHSGAVSVPMLVLPDGRTLLVGDPASSVAILKSQPASPVTLEHGATGQQASRTYHIAGMEFVVVTADDRIVAIFR